MSRRMKQRKMAEKVQQIASGNVQSALLRTVKDRKPLIITEKLKREIMQATGGMEPDHDVRLLCPVISMKLWGRSGPDGLTAAQRRQVGNFARDVVKALRQADRLKS